MRTQNFQMYQPRKNYKIPQSASKASKAEHTGYDSENAALSGEKMTKYDMHGATSGSLTNDAASLMHGGDLIDGFENAGGPHALFRQRRYEAASATMDHGLHMYRPKKKQLKQSGSRKAVGTLQAGSKAQHLVLSQNVQNLH